MTSIFLVVDWREGGRAVSAGGEGRGAILAAWGAATLGDLPASHPCSPHFLLLKVTLGFLDAPTRVSPSNNHLYPQLMSPGRGERQAINDLPRWKNERKREKMREKRGASRNRNSTPIHTSMEGQTLTCEQLALTVFGVLKYH